MEGDGLKDNDFEVDNEKEEFEENDR